jgi:hypothetical protein
VVKGTGVLTTQNSKSIHDKDQIFLVLFFNFALTLSYKNKIQIKVKFAKINLKIYNEEKAEMKNGHKIFKRSFDI